MSPQRNKTPMENEKNTERLAGYVIKLGGLAIILALCFYFKNVLVYIVAAFVVSLIGRPIMQLLRKISIKKRHLPDWLLAVLTIILPNRAKGNRIIAARRKTGSEYAEAPFMSKILH